MNSKQNIFIEKEISLIDLFYKSINILFSLRKTILALFLISITIGFFSTASIEPKFTANTRILIEPKNENLKNYILPLIGASKELAKEWKLPLGMVFIDGGHSMEAAVADYEYWHPHIVKNGYLLIHDVFPNPKDGGRPPYEIFCKAKKSKKFKEISLIKSLAILKKIKI